MRSRSFLPVLCLSGSLALLTACDNDNQPLGTWARFTQFSILAEVTNVGTGADANGFLISIDPSDTVERVGAGEPLRIDQAKGGTWTITLSDVGGNCDVVDGDTRTISVVERDQRTLAKRADFTVDCG